MGHSDATVTLANYTHPMEDHDAAAAAALEALFAQLLPPPAAADPDPGADVPADPDAPSTAE